MISATVALATSTSVSPERSRVGSASANPTPPRPTSSPANPVARPGRAVVGSGVDTRGTVQRPLVGAQLRDLTGADVHAPSSLDRSGNGSHNIHMSRLKCTASRLEVVQTTRGVSGVGSSLVHFPEFRSLLCAHSRPQKPLPS